MPRRILFLLVAFAAFTAVGLPRFWAQSGQTASLQIVSVDPFPGQPLPLDGDVAFHFNRRIDCGAARAAFRIEPFIDGSLVCDGYSLTFSPADAYPRGTSYVFELAASVTALDGASMPAPYRAAYTSVGFLQAAEILPPPQTQDAPTDSDIAIVFDRPVVPPLMASDRAELPQPLQLSPAVDGIGEWVNSSVYVFSPSQTLRGDTNYTASIAAGLQAPDGSILASDLVWSFQTAAIEIVSIEPPPADDLPLNPRIQLRFNQTVDEDAVETAFYFRPAAASEGQNSQGSFEWDEDRQGFMFKPDLQLQPAAAYELGLNDMASWSYTTAPLPSILRTVPADGDQDVSRGGFEIFFASPMNIDTLADKISIEPAPDVPPRFYYDDWDNSYWVSFDARPSTDYTIQAAPGMQDIYGHVIKQGLTFRYATAPRPPTFGIEMPGEVGFYNAYHQPTQLDIYHRGVKRVDLRLHHVPIHDWIAGLIREDYAPPTENYRPLEGQMLWQWRIESNAPPNDLRYERLSLGLGEAICPGAPPPRLKIGDTAVVATESFPLRARPVPADGEPLELLYHGYALPIIAGPRCADSWLWWQVELRDGRAAWVAEGDLEGYFLTPRAAALAGQLPPGLYFLEAVSPDLEQPYWQTRHFLNVATAALTVKQSISRITVWATDVQSGQPIIGETISLYDASHEVMASGATDDDGIVQLDIPLTRDLHTRFAAVLDSAQHFGLGYSDWTNGLEPYQFDYYLAYHPPAFQSYLYTDRPVYRPGQPVYFRGIVRSKDDVAYGLPDLETAAVSISGARGEIVYEQALPLNDFGSFSGVFDLAPQAAPGAYTLSVDLPSTAEHLREGSDISFLVAEYQVDIQPTAPPIVQGSAAFELESPYFSGGQAAWRPRNDAAVELIPERTHYRVGDRAQILIASPYQGAAEALIAIERGGLIHAEHITLNSNSHIYEFDIRPEHAPNIYVSAFIVKAVDESHPTASYRMGMTHLLVDSEQKELKIDIQADRQLAAPQETVAYRLRVTDEQGRPIRAEIGVALTDLAALSLRPASGPTLLESFYSPQGLAVRTSSSLTLNAGEITASLSEQQDGGIFDENILELRGEWRGEWIDAPYWNPSLRTDAAGEAVVHLRLPDSLTTWRLDARAVTSGGDGDTLVGQAHFDLRSARPLIIRPSTPRFFTVGDQAHLTAVVHSDLDRAVTAQVSLENRAGLRLIDGRQTQRVTIPAKGQTRLSWLVSVDDVESVAPLFAAQSGGGEYSDASISPAAADFDGRLPVYRYETSETVGLSGEW